MEQEPQQPGTSPDADESPEAAPKRRFGRRPSGSTAAPTLGFLPSGSRSPAPTLAEPDGAVATAFGSALERLQAATTDQVFLVTGTGGGSRAGNAALNLGIAAARGGLRAVLVDADPTGGGATQYLRTGDGPGLAELAAGEADLQAASRLLGIGNGSRLPVVPSGSGLANAALDSAAMADAIDRISEHSDLVLLSLPQKAPDQHFDALGAHADGSILLVGGRTSAKSKEAAATRLAEVGAPVVGIVERAADGRKARRARR